MENPALALAKEISNEAAQLAESLEAQGNGGSTPEPTNYSSSVTSCEVDPATGNITLKVTLYPGATPIEPPSVSGDQPAPVEVPAGGLDTPTEPAAPESDVVTQEDVPPGQVPVQE